jgi:hypothetical protein
MKKLFVSASVLGLALSSLVFAADDKKSTTVSGVLIDNACATAQLKKDNPEEAAAKHPLSCAKKEGCAKSGYAVIVGKKAWKFDEKGNELAKDYLGTEDASTKVKIEGTPDEEKGTIAVTKISKVEEKKAS